MPQLLLVHQTTRLRTQISALLQRAPERCGERVGAFPGRQARPCEAAERQQQSTHQISWPVACEGARYDPRNLVVLAHQPLEGSSQARILFEIAEERRCAAPHISHERSPRLYRAVPRWPLLCRSGVRRPRGAPYSRDQDAAAPSAGIVTSTLTLPSVIRAQHRVVPRECRGRESARHVRDEGRATTAVLQAIDCSSCRRPATRPCSQWSIMPSMKWLLDPSPTASRSADQVSASAVTPRASCMP